MSELSEHWVAFTPCLPRWCSRPVGVCTRTAAAIVMCGGGLARQHACQPAPRDPGWERILCVLYRLARLQLRLVSECWHSSALADKLLNETQHPWRPHGWVFTPASPPQCHCGFTNATWVINSQYLKYYVLCTATETPRKKSHKRRKSQSIKGEIMTRVKVAILQFQLKVMLSKHYFSTSTER